MRTDPTPYPQLNIVLSELVQNLQAILAETLVGAYLQGSFALGDFDKHSDVDFIVVIREELSDDAVSTLQEMHARIYDMTIPWAQHLEGSYFASETLRPYSHAGIPLWYLDHGSRSLVRSDHCNTVVVRWVLREHGVVLTGPDPATLVDPIPVQALRKSILASIRHRSEVILRDTEPFNNRFYQSYIVLTYCRMLNDLQGGTPGSKRAGAEWAKANLDRSWARLIDRTWAGRPDPVVSVRQPADPSDFEATLRFVRYVLDESERYASANGLE